MFNNELKEKAKELVDLDRAYVKPVNQSVYILEEMAELSKEILKDQRKKGNREHIKEEIADVLCTILTYAYSKNIDVDELESMMMKKYDRGISRILVGEQ